MKKSFNNIAPILSILSVGMLSLSLLQPIIPLYLVNIGFSSKATGVLISVLWLGMVVGESLWGWIADKTGIRFPMIWGTVISGIILSGFLLAGNTYFAFIAILCLGLSRSALFGPTRGYVGKHSPVLKKAAFMGLLLVVGSASGSLGSFLSGFIASHMGYFRVFHIAISVYILGGIITIMVLKGPKFNAPKHLPAKKRSFSEVWQKYRCIRPLCLITICTYFASGIFITFFPLFITQVHGLDVFLVGIFFTVKGLIPVVFGVPMGILADRKGKKLFMIAALMVSAVSMIGISFSNNILFLLISVVVFSIGSVMFNPSASALLSDIVSSESQGAAMGIYGGICENSGIMAGAFAGGFIWNIFGPQATFWAGSLVCVLGIILCLNLNTEKIMNVNKDLNLAAEEIKGSGLNI